MAAGLSAAEREELTALRRRVKVLAVPVLRGVPR
jgi:hypothetical protein